MLSILTTVSKCVTTWPARLAVPVTMATLSTLTGEHVQVSSTYISPAQYGPIEHLSLFMTYSDMHGDNVKHEWCLIYIRRLYYTYAQSLNELLRYYHIS